MSAPSPELRASLVDALVDLEQHIRELAAVRQRGELALDAEDGAAMQKALGDVLAAAPGAKVSNSDPPPPPGAAGLRLVP